MKQIVIVGATSGIGCEVAKCYIAAGWRVGVAGRRTEQLEKLRMLAPDRVVPRQIDVTEANATASLQALIEAVGGMDVFLLCSGVGKQNFTLDEDVEMLTVQTNADGFARMTGEAFRYFLNKGGGHIAAISSVAGTKGMGIAPSYSATKRFQSNYLEALEQLARMHRVPIVITDIRPGFVATPLLKDGTYPMLMQAPDVARRMVRAIEARKRVAVIDGRYALLVVLWKLIPRWLWVRLSFVKS